MLTTILLAVISADPNSAHYDRGAAFLTSAKISVAANPPGTKGYSITGKSDYRVTVAETVFDTYARHSRMPSISFTSRCHCKRIYDSMREHEARYSQGAASLADPPAASSLSSDERQQFKEACFIMARAPDSWTMKRALEHLFIVADRGDLPRLKSLLNIPSIDRGLIYLTFGRIGDDSILPILSRELRGPFWEEAAAALENMGGTGAIAAFEKGMGEVRELKRKEELSLILDRMKNPQPQQ